MAGAALDTTQHLAFAAASHRAQPASAVNGKTVAMTTRSRAHAGRAETPPTFMPNRPALLLIGGASAVTWLARVKHASRKQ